MPTKVTKLHRRRFLKTALSAAGAAIAAPTIIPSSALGLDGTVAPSERVIVGGIGIGNRGSYDLGCFLEQKDVQFLAVCDIKAARRTAVKKMVDERYGNEGCGMYRDFRKSLDDLRSQVDFTDTFNSTPSKPKPRKSYSDFDDVDEITAPKFQPPPPPEEPGEGLSGSPS